MKSVLTIFSLGILLSIFQPIAAQDINDLLGLNEKFVSSTFRAPIVINTQTIETLPAHTLEFSIKHRFGEISFDESFYKQFLGLDMPANIRFGFIYAPFNFLYAGCGRTKNGKTYDMELKWRFLKQRTDHRVPVSIAAYAHASINTESFQSVPDYAFFEDSITPFEYKFAHRLKYHLEIIAAKKFGKKFALQLSPDFVYRNLVPPLKDNHTLALVLSGALRVSQYSSIVFEGSYLFNNKPENGAFPVAIGWEFGTVGHTFEIVVSSSPEISESALYSVDGVDYKKGKFILGFNLRRTFWLKKKQL